MKTNLNLNVQMMGDDLFFQDLYRWLCSLINFHRDTGLAFSDSVVAASNDILAVMLAHSAGQLDKFFELNMVPMDRELPITSKESEIFALGICVGGWFQKQGYMFSQKPSPKELQ